MINQESGTVYESPDGGRTIYARKSGESVRTVVYIDEMYKKEQELVARWAKLKHAVMLDDPVINDLLNKIEVVMELKK